MIPEQSSINDEERRGVAGRVAERNDDGNIADKWEFEKILDVHDEDIDGLTYLVKWKYNDVPSWQPESDLRGCEKALTEFHKRNSEKPGPPSWMKIPAVAISKPLKQSSRSGRKIRPTWKSAEQSN